MLGRVLLALLAVPLADALLLVVVATRLGLLRTVALVVLTALLGMAMVRAAGRRTLSRLQRKLARGEPPTDELLDGGLLLVAGAFLLTPGLVTDALGFLLVVPPTRALARRLARRWVVPRLDRRAGGFASGRVYTFGFPGDGEDGFPGEAGRGTDPDDGSGPDRRDGSGSDDTINLDPSEYDVDGGRDDNGEGAG
ncbi:MAG: FxsA family protein [Halobacteriaceae archaeon]